MKGVFISFRHEDKPHLSIIEGSKPCGIMQEIGHRSRPDSRL